MSKTPKQYAQDFIELNTPKTALLDSRDILNDVPDLRLQLSSPTVTLEQKMDIVDRVFPQVVREIIKTLIINGDIGMFHDIIDEYEDIERRNNKSLYVLLRYVTPPTDEQLRGIRRFVLDRYGKEQVVFHSQEDPSLVSGFKLTIGNEEYDWSAQGRMNQLQERLQQATSGSIQSIISILRSQVEDFDLDAKNQEVGIVTSVGDGIAIVDGIDHAAYGEIVIFDSGIKGMVQDVRENSMGVILFGSDTELSEGSRVIRTEKSAGIAVSDAILGRVVNALGEAIDGGHPIVGNDYRPIEHKAPGVIARKEVNVPMQTGILAIDSMFPIGRGQRELIIGDRQTGKTALAVDTILNQKGNGVVCIYVAIGQKASTVAQIVNTLKTHGAMDYTVVVSATASDPATLQYIAPYSGAAIGEHFMDEGRDVLIVYDDLSKHAQAYRAISLLLKRPPGREAYPGDVFYLHSRLLERACRRDEKHGGGSMTALPIIETQAGDVSAYIPTNVISITDGQIFLETELFHSGQRPAVNVGLSVSRVGGKAQTKAMKSVAGTLRIDLAQYREMESFTQFSSDLDEATRNMLEYGRSLYQLLKQPLYHPMSVTKQVVLLCAANARLLTDVPAGEMEAFKDGLMDYLNTNHAELMEEIADGGALSDDQKKRVQDAVRQYKSR
jgi:F-type H+-transporting ATPase subunit alpha